MQLLFDAAAASLPAGGEIGSGSGREPPDPALLERLYARARRPAPSGRPWVAVNMVASLDGAVTDPGGRSGGLSSEADKAAFRTLRAAADVILVGAGTARAEDYGPVRIDPAARAARVARGQAPLPRLAIVTTSMALEPDLRMFSAPDQRPLIVTTRAGAATHHDRLDAVAELRGHGDDAVDLAAALAALASDGHGLVLCEGGPTLNGTLRAIDAVDELCLSVSPVVSAGSDHGLFHVAPGQPTRELGGWDLAHVLEADGMLLLRYVRHR